MAATNTMLFSAPANSVADELDQHFTPLWAAERIISEKFSDLRPGNLVLEPTAGNGSFLRALREVPGVDAVGIEIDPRLAAIAHGNSGFPVIVGDIRTVNLPDRVDAVVGNVPFNLDLFDCVLARIRPLLPAGGRAGFLLPSYFFQTEGRTLTYSQSWSIRSENVPRRLWAGLVQTLVFAEFTADSRHELIGFFLYPELAAVRDLPSRYREDMSTPTGGLWPGVFKRALTELGGEADLQAIYEVVEGKRMRPTANRFWREALRKASRRGVDEGLYDCTARGKYRLAEAA